MQKDLDIAEKERSELDVYTSSNELGNIEKEINSDETYIEESEDEEEYECERCFKKISYEEWETYDMMCEECFMDVHLDEHGNYHDEEIGY